MKEKNYVKEKRYRIDELLNQREYDIYNNRHIRDEEIMEIAEIISTDKSIDLKEYFDLLKASSKFCWFNYLRILEKLPEEDKIRGISLWLSYCGRQADCGFHVIKRFLIPQTNIPCFQQENHAAKKNLQI